MFAELSWLLDIVIIKQHVNTAKDYFITIITNK